MTEIRRTSSNAASVEGVAVRPAREEDLPGILRISNWAIQHTAANFKTEPDSLSYWEGLWRQSADKYPWFTAAIGDEVVGFATASAYNSRCAYAYTAEVSAYVDPAHHGKGVGRRLYQQLMPTLKAQGYKTAVAVIALPNPVSERLHARFSFQKMGVLRRVGWKFGIWRDVSYWELLLEEGEGNPDPIRPMNEVLVPSS